MSKRGRILQIEPRAAIPGGEVAISCEDFAVDNRREYSVLFDGVPAQLVGASPRRAVAIVPETVSGNVNVQLTGGGEESEPHRLTVGREVARNLHLVASPAYDPNEDALIVTRSGSRGQQLPVTVFRLQTSGDLEDITGEVMNPTGIAFDQNGQLFVTSRAEGTVYRINREDEPISFATDLGIATGLAFNQRGEMFVGDRSGTIFQVNAIGETSTFATLEQSIAAYHIAFGLDNALYVTRPNVASYDAIMRVDETGEVAPYYRGLGRPQGLAFDRDGNLYVAACLRERRGIIRVSPGGERADLFVAGMNLVGLCFGRSGELYVASNEAVYELPLGIYGTLVN